MSLQSAIDAITAQQPKLRNDVWMVGEQLKDLITDESEWADLVEQDLKNREQSLEAVAKQIRERAKKNKVGGFGCVTPKEADAIIRKVYCIPERGERPKPQLAPVINLEDFF